MHHVSSDDVTILHRKQPTKKPTIIIDDLSTFMTKNGFWGMNLLTLEEDQDV